MSMPSSTIRCTGCDYETIDHCQPIRLTYRLEDGSEVSGGRSVGWCYSCDSYVDIENHSEQAIYDRIATYHELGNQSPGDEQKVLIDLAKRRVSKMSCLECWSKDTVPLDVDMTEIETLEQERKSKKVEWESLRKRLDDMPLMDFATNRQKMVLKDHSYGNTEFQRQAYLLKVEKTKKESILAQAEKFFQTINEALSTANTHQKFRDFKHKCGGTLLRDNDGKFRSHFVVTEYVLDPEGHLIEERRPER
jgi:hypothetical protein